MILLNVGIRSVGWNLGSNECYEVSSIDAVPGFGIKIEEIYRSLFLQVRKVLVLFLR